MYLLNLIEKKKSSREPNQKRSFFGHYSLFRPPLTEQLSSQPSLLKRFSSLGACSPIGNFISLYHWRALALSIKVFYAFAFYLPYVVVDWLKMDFSDWARSLLDKKVPWAVESLLSLFRGIGALIRLRGSRNLQEVSFFFIWFFFLPFILKTERAYLIWLGS